MNRWKSSFRISAVLIAVYLLLPHTVWAQLTSPNYKVDETLFGTGGELDASSANYRAKQAAGELGVGSTSSTNNQARAGFNTDRSEYLQIQVTGGAINLGVLSPSSTTTTTGTFSVKAYLAHGYVVQTASDPPTYNGTSIDALTTPTAPSTNVEQFGINLVANTNPTTFGANPAQLPDTTFGFGQVASDYATPNLFKYVKGDVIAESLKSSGTTQYTISYIYNINQLTPGGTYIFNQVLVATATY